MHTWIPDQPFVPRLAAQNAQIRSSVSIIDIEQTAEHIDGYASAVALTTGSIWRRPQRLACLRECGGQPEVCEQISRAAAAHRLGGGHDHANDGRGVLGGSLSCLVDGVYRVLLA